MHGYILTTQLMFFKGFSCHDNKIFVFKFSSYPNFNLPYLSSSDKIPYITTSDEIFTSKLSFFIQNRMHYFFDCAPSATFGCNGSHAERYTTIRDPHARHVRRAKFEVVDRQKHACQTCPSCET